MAGLLPLCTAVVSMLSSGLALQEVPHSSGGIIVLARPTGIILASASPKGFQDQDDGSRTVRHTNLIHEVSQNVCPSFLELPEESKKLGPHGGATHWAH